MNYFCTYCDRGYAARLLALHQSLASHGESFVLHVLCWDEEIAAVVKGTGSAELVAIGSEIMLAANPDFAAVRDRRSRVEFIFTATPVLVRYCLELNPAAKQMTYLDADLFFFGPPSAVFAEQGDAAVGIVPHRFPARLQSTREQYGRYNVSWVSFRRVPAGLACLEWWRERCLEWCHDRVDAGRFADQGYLDEFSRRFGDVKVLDHPGINAAPWNMERLTVAVRNGTLLVAGRPLLFYHFQGIREVVPGWFEPGLRQYRTPLTPALRELVYLPYLQRLARLQTRLQKEHGLQPQFVTPRLNGGQTWRDRWERFKARHVLLFLGRLRKQLIKAGDHEA